MNNSAGTGLDLQDASSNGKSTRSLPADDPDVLVRVENVSKKYCQSLKRSLYYGVCDISSALIPWGKHASDHCDSPLPHLRDQEFWAIQNVSFELRRGQCLGLIGHNGAGKSTLLKVLNGLVPPDTGRITMKGRVAALIELNAGFNPILTGRENVYNQAALLGFTRAETVAKFDDIVDFSEIDPKFLDMPVQNYSSGMRVRLGFAIASQLEPDILLIDEVLAVGDVGFRAKCLARMAELLQKTAFIFVSHSMIQVGRIATEIMHLHQGQVRSYTKDRAKGLESYYNTFHNADKVVMGTGQVRVTDIDAQTGSHAARDGQLTVEWHEEIRINIECEFNDDVDAATVQLLIWNQELMPVIDVVGPDYRRIPITPGPDGRCRIESTISGIQLNSGLFALSIIILSSDGMTMLCQIDQALELRVMSNLGSGSSVLWPARWEIT